MAGTWRVAGEAIVAACVAALISGCGLMGNGHGVSDPLTPQQSKAQVVDAARDVVGALDRPVLEAFFWHASCNDQGKAPFRGQMRIAYPPAADSEESDAEIAAMAQRLQSSGWSADSEFKSHGTVLEKNNVVAVFRAQTVSVPTRNVELFGECRDITTTKADTKTESIDLA